MNLASVAIRYRPVVLTLVTLLTLWGAFTFVTMPRREDPEFTIRSCVVSTQWPGAPTVKVEEPRYGQARRDVGWNRRGQAIRSTTINGLSTIYVDVEDKVTSDTIQNVWDKVRAKVELVRMPNRTFARSSMTIFGDTSILVLGVYQVPLEGQNEVDDRNRYTARDLDQYADQVQDAEIAAGHRES